MSAMASQITGLTIVYSAVYSGTDKKKHQSSASLAFVRGIHWWPVNSPHKWPVMRSMFPLMTSSCPADVWVKSTVILPQQASWNMGNMCWPSACCVVWAYHLFPKEHFETYMRSWSLILYNDAVGNISVSNTTVLWYSPYLRDWLYLSTTRLWGLRCERSWDYTQCAYRIIFKSDWSMGSGKTQSWLTFQIQSTWSKAFGIKMRQILYLFIFFIFEIIFKFSNPKNFVWMRSLVSWST